MYRIGKSNNKAKQKSYIYRASQLTYTIFPTWRVKRCSSIITIRTVDIIPYEYITAWHLKRKKKDNDRKGSILLSCDPPSSSYPALVSLIINLIGDETLTPQLMYYYTVSKAVQ